MQPKLGVIQEVTVSRFKTEIPIIQLTHDGEDTVQESKDDVANLRISSDVSEEMEISNFIQSEQQHAVTTSEYSSLSSLSSPPLSFSSRLPPDGQEFPPVCQETRPVTENIDSDTMTTPKLPKTEPRKLSATKAPLENNSASSPWVKSYSVTDSTGLGNSKSSLWRKDRNSTGSVKDKIAIFSSGENNEQPLLPLTKVYKSSENLLEEKPTLYDKKNQISKSCLVVNSIASTNQSEKKNIYNNKLATTNKNLDNNEPEVKPNLNYTSSFNAKPNIQLHSRSQSMLDMSNFDSSTWNNPNPDSRRLTLNSLIEQRRRGFSKLRGLVIPPADTPMAEPVLDLPEIRVKDPTNLVSKSNSISSRTSDKDEPIVSHQRSLSTSLQSPTWKSNSISNQTNLPRYSPAFKRKYLQVYVMEQSSAGTMSSCSESPKTSDSVFNSDFDISSTSLSSLSTEVFRKSSVCSDNGSFTNGDNSKIESASTQSVDNIMSPSNSEISFEYYQSTNSTNSLDTQSDTRSSDIRQSYYPNKTCTLTRNKIKLHRLEDDSDNDSAVSSSQSSYISRECSPLPSPLDYTNHINFSISTEENCNGHSLGNKQKEMYSTIASNGGRVLKSQSVEAINRKNILASAKCRSGRDFKNGSPLIQRKLSTSEEEKQEETNEEVSPPVEVEEDVKPSVVNTDEDETDMQSTSSLSDSISTASFVSKDSDKLEAEIKKPEIPVTIPQSPKTPTTSEMKPTLKEITTSNVVLRNSGLPTPRKYLADKIERPISMLLPNSSRFDAKKRCSVNDIRKQFEQFEIEQQKPLSYPEIKSPNKSLSKVSPSKLPTAKSTENFIVSSSIPLANKDVKTTPFTNKKSAIPTKISIPKEEMEEILKEVNEGLAADNALYVNPNDVIAVQLQREMSGGSVGITLTGGTDYEAKEITVHKVFTGSCAHKDGRLKKGDRVLAINGKRMMGLTHKDSVDILKDPTPDKVTLVVLLTKGKTTQVSNTATKIRKTSSEVSIPDVSSSSLEAPSSKENPLILVELLKDRSGLGFSLDGGKDSLKGDMPLIIKKVFTGGAAEKCGVLQAGDKIIEVNSVKVQKMTRMEVWGIMRKLPDGKVSLTVRR